MLVYIGNACIASLAELDRVVEFLTSFKQDFLKQTAHVHEEGSPLKAPDLDTPDSAAEVVLLDRIPMHHVHRVLYDGTKVWLSEAERSSNRVPWPPL